LNALILGYLRRECIIESVNSPSPSDKKQRTMGIPFLEELMMAASIYWSPASKLVPPSGKLRF
jgi:hypothetical protein